MAAEEAAATAEEGEDKKKTKELRKMVKRAEKYKSWTRAGARRVCSVIEDRKARSDNGACKEQMQPKSPARRPTFPAKHRQIGHVHACTHMLDLKQHVAHQLTESST
jgi:polyphosphate kinase 2 (PPK2 family)